MDDHLKDFLTRWASERRPSLLAGQPQDVAMSEIIEVFPELQLEELVPLAVELLDVLHGVLADLPSVETSVVLDVGSFANMVTEPPDLGALDLAPHTIQIHATPLNAGTVREIEHYERPLDWLDGGYITRYQISRPLGPEFEDWEYNALVVIRHA